jgi:cell division protein FtsZ
MADDVLYQGVKGVTDLMVRPGLINLDFADVRAVMDEMGKAMMGTGEATREARALQAAEKAIANPLLDEISLRGAKGVLINITGGHDLTLFELDEAANRIREEVDADANIIVGSTMDDALDGGMRVSVVATGIDAAETNAAMPLPRRSMKAPLPQAEVEAPAPVEQAPVAAEAAPVAPAAAPQPAAAAPAEPSLFPQMDAQHAQMDEVIETPAAPAAAPSFDAVSAGSDLPPPAYQPAATQQVQTQVFEEEEAQDFVAPQRPAPGTPTPQLIQRLQAAVEKAPAAPARPAAAAPAQEPRAEERPRFGINSLINKMTGHAAEQPAARPASVAPVARQQPAVQSHEPSVQMEEDQDRIEIPAFLRRQAN